MRPTARIVARPDVSRAMTSGGSGRRRAVEVGRELNRRSGRNARGGGGGVLARVSVERPENNEDDEPECEANHHYRSGRPLRFRKGVVPLFARQIEKGVRPLSAESRTVNAPVVSAGSRAAGSTEHQFIHEPSLRSRVRRIDAQPPRRRAPVEDQIRWQGALHPLLVTK